MLGKTGHRGRQGRQGSQGVQGIQGVEGVEGDSFVILQELRANQKDVIKTQTDLLLGQGHLTDSLKGVENKVDAVYRSINVDNGDPCIKTRLRCNEDDIAKVQTELVVVKALKSQRKSIKQLVMEWGSLICAVVIMLKAIGVIKWG